MRSGKERGDAMMPLLYALGQHQALLSVQFQLRPSEGLLAFHDDIFVVTFSERTCEVHSIWREALWDNSRIQIHVGKTQIWNRAGVAPCNFDKFLRAARLVDAHAKLWFGDLATPPELAPVNTDAYVRAHLQDIVDTHQVLLSRIPAVPDLQSAWVLLLYCAATRANYFRRVCVFRALLNRLLQHDNNVWRCLCQLIGHLPHRPTWERGSHPLHMGGIGLRSASRSSHAASWGSWADCLATIRVRHVHVAATMAAALSDPPASATCWCCPQP